MNPKLLLPLLIVLTFSCAFPGGKKSSHGGNKMTETIGTIPFVPIMQGNAGRSKLFNRGPQFKWLKSQAAWQRFGFEDYFKKMQTTTPKVVTELDFTKHDVLICAYGEAGNNGASILLEKITANGKTIFTVQRKDSDPRRPQAQVMTHPFHMVRIDKGLDSKTIEFIVNGKPGTFEINFEE